MFIRNVSISNANLFNHTKFLIFDHVLCHVSTVITLEAQDEFTRHNFLLLLAFKAGVFWSAIHELFSGMTLCRHLGR